MKAKLIGAAATALLTIATLGSTSASAATEFGNNCVGTALTEAKGITLFELAVPSNPLPNTAPIAGVITSWKVISGAAVAQNLRIVRYVGPKVAQTIAESPGFLASGANTFSARIPVQVGDRLALFGPTDDGNLVCQTPGSSALIGGFEMGGDVGSTSPVTEVTAEAAVPVSARIEPDADNDGYGDETQDKCPQLASTQAECPVIAVDMATAIKRKGSVVVLLTTTGEAPVKVAGTVSLGKGKKAKLGSKAKTVPPGKVARFTLKFPKKLKKRLEELTRKQSLQLKVTASATDLVGRVSTDKLSVRLKGQASG